MDERQVARFLCLGRVAIGAALVLAPGRAGAGWIGPSSQDPTVKVALRALGVRDAAIGIGAYQALGEGSPAGRWIRAGVLSDTVDAAATVAAFRHLGARRALPVLAIAAGAAVLGARLSTAVD